MIASFSPGDATRYTVLYHKLSDEDRKSIGGGLASGACIFGFCAGDMRPMPVSRFQPTGGIALPYYQDCMGEQHDWTAKAGYLVLSFLTGRFYTHDCTDVLGAWKEDWMEQLAHLKETAI